MSSVVSKPESEEPDVPKSARDELRKRIQALHAQRIDADKTLKEIEFKEKRLFKQRENGEPPRVVKRGERDWEKNRAGRPISSNKDSAEERPLKRRATADAPVGVAKPALQSAAVVVASETEQGEVLDNVESEEKKSERPKRTFDLQSRNKRMFGSLLFRTLADAQKEITDLEQTDTGRRKKLVEERVAKRKEEMKVELVEEAKKKVEEEKARTVAKRKELLEEQAVLEAQLQETIMRDHERTLSNFLVTKTRPPLFFLPKTHTPQTEALLEQARKERLAKLELITVEPLPVDEKEDDEDLDAPEGDRLVITVEKKDDELADAAPALERDPAQDIQSAEVSGLGGDVEISVTMSGEAPLVESAGGNEMAD
jgi:pinin